MSSDQLFLAWVCRETRSHVAEVFHFKVLYGPDSEWFTTPLNKFTIPSIAGGWYHDELKEFCTTSMFFLGYGIEDSDGRCQLAEELLKKALKRTGHPRP